MARIDLDTIKKIEKERISIHDKVMTTYSVFDDHGKKYVQIDTYGKSGRDLPGRVSQSFQFDKDSAEFMAKLLVNEFDLKL